ncbi:MAG: deoxynucleoside kinase [Saprospiraceae bacterium]
MSEKFPYEFICIEGNIGAGKTSFCQLLNKEYNCSLVLEEFDENPFLPYFYQDKNRYAFPVELFFMTERYKQLENTILTPDLFAPFTAADYFFTKSLLFAKNNLVPSEFRLFQKMFRALDSSFPNPELLVYFHRDVDILMDHIQKRGRDYEKYIKRDYLLEIQNTYFDYFRNIVSFPVLIIDLKTLDFLSDDKNYEAVKQIIMGKYLPGVHRISLIV